MVEMLGVLAIMGVLSVGGLMGYQYAINKYRANEIINEVKKRAVIVSSQKERRGEATLQEFDEYIINAYRTTLEEYGWDPDRYFMIDVSGVQEGVCEQVIDANWYLPKGVFIGEAVAEKDRCRGGDITLSFVFDNWLGSGGTLIPSGAEVCSENSECTKPGESESCSFCLKGRCATSCSEREECTATGCECTKGFEHDDYDCVCPVNKYIVAGECQDCPSGSYTDDINAITCKCDLDVGYVWDNDACKLCTTYFTDAQNTNEVEVERCNSTCSEGYYMKYALDVDGNSGATKSFGVGGCAPLPAKITVSSLSDARLLERFNDSTYYRAEKDLLFGTNPTAAEIRNKLESILGNSFMVPNANWFNVQGVCQAYGGRIPSNAEYHANNERLVIAARFFPDSYLNWGGFWTNTRGHRGYAPTTGEGKGGHWTPNALMALCIMK